MSSLRESDNSFGGRPDGTTAKRGGIAMNDFQLLNTRRQFFRECGIGLGGMALGSLLARETQAAPAINPLAPKPPHFNPKAKAVIFLFMAGGPSQFELFEPKPELQKLHGEPIPESFVKGKRFAFMDTFAKERPK